MTNRNGPESASPALHRYFVNVRRRVPAFFWQNGIVVTAPIPSRPLERVRSGLTSKELHPEWDPLPEDLGVEPAPGEPGPIEIDLPEAIPFDEPIRDSSTRGGRR